LISGREAEAGFMVAMARDAVDGEVVEVKKR